MLFISLIRYVSVCIIQVKKTFIYLWGERQPEHYPASHTFNWMSCLRLTASAYPVLAARNIPIASSFRQHIDTVQIVPGV